MALRERVHLDNTRRNANWMRFHSHNRIEETEVDTLMQKKHLYFNATLYCNATLT
jgi:hypothetical protein